MQVRVADGAETDESIEILRTLWREPVADYQGRFHRLDGANMEPRPPGAGPPIWIGGSRRAATRRAARYGDGWLPYGLDVAGSRAGAAARRELTQGRPCPTVANVLNLRIVRPDEPAALRSTTSRMRKAFAGGADAVAEYLEEYRRAGPEYAVCYFKSEDVDDLLRQMRTFAERIAPRFTDAAYYDSDVHRGRHVGAPVDGVGDHRAPVGVADEDDRLA